MSKVSSWGQNGGDEPPTKKKMVASSNSSASVVKPAPLSKQGSSMQSHMSTASSRHKRVPMWKRQILSFVDHKAVTIVMTVMTIYALFGDDFRLAVAPPSADDTFYVFSFIALLLFFAELSLNSIAKCGYLFKFYFWLDLVATLSLIPDIGWMWDPIVGAEESTTTDGSAGAIRAGRASRAGTKAGRIVRIVRLVRLIRIAKLYKHVKESQEVLSNAAAGGMRTNANGHRMSSTRRRSDLPSARRKSMVNDEPSQVGKQLSDLTTRRVILLVLAMIIMLPFFDVNTFADMNNPQEQFGIDTLHKLSFDDPSSPLFNSNLQQYYSDAGMLVHLQIQGETQDQTLTRLRALDNFDESTYQPSIDDVDSDYRPNEVSSVSITGCYDASGTLLTTVDPSTCASYAYFDQTANAVTEAWLNVGKTLFVMVVLATAAIMFTKDAENLVIQPIERMVCIVKQLAENPLDAVTDPQSMMPHLAGGTSSYETALLERSLTKIGGLLQIGFGEAGAQVIAHNMRKGGSLNPMVGGQKMYGAFGFCDIRQFTDATECLQEEVMVFVNRIGDIVHFATHKYCGAANKNVGDAFLLVWRMPDGDGVEELEDAAACDKDIGGSGSASGSGGSGSGSSGGDSSNSTGINGPLSRSKVVPMALTQRPSSRASDLTSVTDRASVATFGDAKSYCTHLCDNALYAFLKMMVDIENSNTSGILGQFAVHPKIQERFPMGYKVRMGFGLHYGWAIEGAIGSKYKIDASYLSPNVNISARLEAATKQYGTPLLMSDAFAKRLSEDAMARCRHLDTVTVKGSKVPIELFTFDVCHIPSRLGCDIPDCQAEADFESDPHVPMLQQGLPAKFMMHFRLGIKAYIDGTWDKAKQELEKSAETYPNDGPTNTIMKVMRESSFRAPRGWPGWRELTDK